jgi:hypothetical protein
VIGRPCFSLFALQHFERVEGGELVGMAGMHRPAALAAALRSGVPDLENFDELSSRDESRGGWATEGVEL